MLDGDGLGDETRTPAWPGGSHSTPPPAPDPYAVIRKSGPSVGLPGSGTRPSGAVLVTVTNPYAFAIDGKLTLKKGRKIAGKACVKLAASATRTLKVKVRECPPASGR